MAVNQGFYNAPQQPQQGGANGLPGGFDHAGFQGAQTRTEQNGTQISPDEFYRFAGVGAGQEVSGALKNTYQQLYKDTAFYNPDGGYTSRAPGTAIMFPNYVSPGSYQAAGPAAQAKDFIPQDITGSPLYQWQQQQGEKALSRLASAGGYANSGREIGAVSDFTESNIAKESERVRQQANLSADRENQRRLFNTDRGNQFTMRSAQDKNSYMGAQSGLYSKLALDSADRQERLSNTQYGRLTGLLDRMMAQSPYSSGVGANSSAANSIQSNANAASGILGQLGSAYASGIVPNYQGAGDGGSGAFNLYGNYANDVNDGRLFNDFLGGLFK